MLKVEKDKKIYSSYSILFCLFVQKVEANMKGKKLVTLEMNECKKNKTWKVRKVMMKKKL